jgi:hypothetical protein
VVLSFLDWVLRRLLELLVLCMRSEREKEIEILVLSHHCTCWSARSLIRSFAQPRPASLGGERPRHVAQRALST